MRFKHFLLPILPSLMLLAPLRAEPISVRHPQATTHGFVLLRTEAGKLLGYGEYTQMPRGNRITSRLILHFNDGSIDEETTVYTQQSTLRFVSDHHVQHGPFFSKPLDMTIDQAGNVTCRSTQEDGSVKTETNHIDLPADLSNGMIATSLLNVRPNAPPFKLGMIAPYGKGRLIQIGISRAEQRSFSCVKGFQCQATVFRIKPEIGGLAGVVAPLVGKQPADLFVWVREGEVPSVVREIGQLSQGGPIVSIELGGAVFAHPRTAAH